MIIRNPYNFIAKHYKLINLIMLLPLFYLIFKFRDISVFFKDYINNNYSTIETNFADSYVSGLLNFVLILMVIYNLFMYFIFTSKKKKNTYYGICIIYFLVLIVFSWLFYAAMNAVPDIDMTVVNLVKDVANLGYLGLYAIVVINLCKAAGFNIKTLKFDNNAELRIGEEDEEELELKLGSEDKSLKKVVVHALRELKYYYFENKFVLNCIGGFFLIIIVVSLYMNFRVYNRSYNINQAFSVSNFTLSIKDSYITNVDYHGNLIDSDKYYLAIKIGLENKREATSIDKSSFRIYIGDTVIYPSYDKASRFIDIGAIYQGETLNTGDENEYVFVYELTKDQIHNSYQMRILNNLTQKQGELVSSYKKITIKPKNITKTVDLGTTSIGNEVSLKETTLGNSTYKLNNYRFESNYQYETEKCTLGRCTTVKETIVPKSGNVLLIVDDNLSLDETTSYYKNMEKDFYSDFVYFNYYPNTGNTQFDSVANKSILTKVNANVGDNIKIYEVSSSVQNVSKLDMVIRIRNSYVTINLK